MLCEFTEGLFVLGGYLWILTRGGSLEAYDLEFQPLLRGRWRMQIDCCAPMDLCSDGSSLVVAARCDHGPGLFRTSVALEKAR